MKKSIALVLSLITTSFIVACGGSDDNSPGSAGSSNSHAGSSNGDAGSSNGGPDDSSGGGSSCAAPEGTSDTCFNCVKSSCSLEYSGFCAANCSTKATSSACLDASTAVGNCISDHCESECNDSSGEGGSRGNDTGGGGGGGGAGAVTAADCQKLEPCCADLTNGPQEACNQIVSLNYGTSCLSTYSLYKCDSVIAAAGKPKTTACKMDTECAQGPYATDAQASACTQKGGTASDTCPKDDVVACCTTGSIEICDYTGHEDPTTEADCTAKSGTFSTTP